MCETCGCGQPDEFTVTKPHGHPHDHEHSYDHDHEHAQDHVHGPDTHTHEPVHERRILDVNKDILYENNLTAARNRGYFEGRKITCFNLVSSPGSGKTTLLEKTILALKDEIKIATIEGDQQSLIDADRIQKTGTPVIQVNTGMGCHLDARMVGRAMTELTLAEDSILFIENVGNLVCPALFDLGESKRVLIMSVTEGDDKPLKYPAMFRSAHLCIINKTDLLPYVTFSVEKAIQNAKSINPDLEFIQLSATKGDGVGEWLDYCRKSTI
jgi:hydrogenase nickel incorporation protein HypB